MSEKKAMSKKLKSILEYGIYALILVAVVFAVPNYLLEKILVDGTSMETTLLNEEHVLIEKVSRYFGGPDRFDIVVFQKNAGNTQKTYIKRVIGLPGESVQIIGSTIYINGIPLEEQYGKDPIEDAGIAKEGIVLGEEEYFVLGDNRSVSIDSRDSRVGIVKKSELDGVVILRIYPFQKFGTVK